jgi:RNA polymerase sigma-70 factor (ECF subfamily)
MIQSSFVSSQITCKPAEYLIRYSWLFSLIRKWSICLSGERALVHLNLAITRLQFKIGNKVAGTSFYSMQTDQNWQELEDIELIKYAQSGDTEAFGVIYERYARVIYRFLNAHLNDFQDAEDILADVFLRVWKVLPKYQDRGTPFLVLLFRIARNRLIDHYRHVSTKRPSVSLDYVNIPDRKSEPADILVAKWENAELRRTMQKLREDYRTVLILRFISGLSPDEAAQVMGRSVGAVRVLQHRALASLRELLNASEK